MNVMSRKRNLKCMVQGCETSALRQNNRKFCGACLEIEINRESKQSAKLGSSNSLPVAISATASTRQQESNGSSVGRHVFPVQHDFVILLRFEFREV